VTAEQSFGRLRQTPLDGVEVSDSGAACLYVFPEQCELARFPRSINAAEGNDFHSKEIT
jgi:hypothetical protein